MNQEQINRDWSESSENYDSIIFNELNSFRAEAWQKQILSKFPEGKALDILDIGCGPGFFSIILSQMGHNVIGIDGAEGMLDKARSNIARTGSSASIQEMDANYLDFPDGSFDLIVSRNVTHTLLDHVRAYTEWKRVLRDDGLLLIYDANWHHHGTIPEVQAQYVEDWRECVRKFGSDFNGNTDPDAAPHLGEPEDHPLKDYNRPDFDIGILKSIGFNEISTDRNITGHLWDEKERTLYRTTPMFEICAAK